MLFYLHFRSDFGISFAQKQEIFEDGSGPYHHRGTKISALISDWKNNIAYGKNPSKARVWLLWQVRFVSCK